MTQVTQVFQLFIYWSLGEHREKEIETRANGVEEAYLATKRGNTVAAQYHDLGQRGGYNQLVCMDNCCAGPAAPVIERRHPADA